MKIKNGYLLREVGSVSVVVAVGEASKDFHKILTLNDTGSFLFKLLSDGADEDVLVTKLCERFDVDKDTAQSDVKRFLQKLDTLKLLENQLEKYS